MQKISNYGDAIQIQHIINLLKTAEMDDEVRIAIESGLNYRIKHIGDKK